MLLTVIDAYHFGLVVRSFAMLINPVLAALGIENMDVRGNAQWVLATFFSVLSNRGRGATMEQLVMGQGVEVIVRIMAAGY
jgi:hypothetical protein